MKIYTVSFSLILVGTEFVRNINFHYFSTYTAHARGNEARLRKWKKTFWEFSRSSGELLKFDQRIVSKLLGGIDARWNTRTRPSFFFPENGSFSVVLFHTRFYRILKSGRTFQKKIYFTIQFSLVIADILSILRSDIEINV